MVETYGAHETRVYYFEETAYGQTPTNPNMLGIPAESVDPSLDLSLIKVRGIGSIDLQAVKKGLRSVSLKISYPLPSEAPINFLQWAKAELNKSLSIQVLYYKGTFASATDIISLLYMGCKFHKLTVECSIEDVVKATAELIGQDLAVGTSKISGATYADYTGAVPFYESYVKKGASTLDRVTDWKFTIENNLKRVPVIRASNGHLLKYLPPRSRELSGELVCDFETKTELDDILNDTEFTLEFGLGATNKAVFSNCKWDSNVLTARIDELVAQRLPFTAKTLTIS